MHHYLAAMRQYAVFRGRASRAEFWWFCAVYLIGAVIVITIDTAIFGIDQEGSGLLAGIYGLAHALPGVAVQIRRLHDIDRTGWWMLLNLTGIGLFVTLVMNMLRGTEGPNRHGADPKAGGMPSSHAAAVHTTMRADPQASFDRSDYAPDYRHDLLGEPSAVARDARGQTQGGDLIGDLERLAQLKASGSLTEAEYDAMKSKLLARTSDG